MKNNRTIIATCIVAAFASSPAFAKDSWHFHEEDWGKTRSYAAVLISQDSVDNWGAWGDFVEPAAGAPLQVAMPGMTAGDSYRNNPNAVVTPEQGCGAGAWCGYAIFNDSTTVKTKGWSNKSFGNDSEGSGPKKFSAATFALTLTADNLPLSKKGGPGDASWSFEPLKSTITPNFTSSGNPVAVKFGGGDLFTYSNELNHFATLGNNTDPSVSGFSHNERSYEALFAVDSGYFEQAITGYKHKVGEEPIYNHRGRLVGWRDVFVILQADPDVAIGEFERSSVESYTSGTGWRSTTTTTTTTTSGYYVAGIATPQAYLDAQRAGDVTAKYVGGSFDGNQQGKVEMTVQFQPGTWTGQWSENGGFDFKAAGTVSGANLSGGVVNTKNMSGTVSGTFYGQQAGSIGGVTDVAKTSYHGTQTQAAIFLVNKIPTPAPSVSDR